MLKRLAMAALIGSLSTPALAAQAADYPDGKGTTVVLALIALAVVWKPAFALAIAGIIFFIGGVSAMVFGGLFGPFVGADAAIGGIVLMGMSRIITLGETVVFHLRGLRRELKEARPASARAPASTVATPAPGRRPARARGLLGRISHALGQ